VLVTIAGVASVRLSRVRQALENMPLWLAVLLAFALWVVISCLWSPFPNHIQAPKFAATFVGGLIFSAAATGSDQARGMTRAAAIAASLVLALLLAVEAIWRLPLNRAIQPTVSDLGLLERNTGRGVTILIAIAFPAIAMLLRREKRVGAGALLLATLIL